MATSTLTVKLDSKQIAGYPRGGANANKTKVVEEFMVNLPAAAEGLSRKLRSVESGLAGETAIC